MARQWFSLQRNRKTANKKKKNQKNKNRKKIRKELALKRQKAVEELASAKSADATNGESPEVSFTETSFERNFDSSFDEVLLDDEEEVDNPVSERIRIKNAVEVLKQKGLHAFLQSSLGGRKKTRESDTMVLHVGRLLTYFAEEYKLKYSDIEFPKEIIEWLKLFITLHDSYAATHADYMRDRHNFRASSVRNILFNVQYCCMWYVHGYLSRPEAACIDLSHLKHTISVVTKSYQKQLRQQQSSMCCLANKIYNRWIPEGGMAELQRAVEAKFKDWFPKVHRHALENPSGLTSQQYKNFMKLLYASLYSHSVQGRVSGIMDMKLLQGDDLVERGHSDSSVFKTNSKFGFQSVTMSEISAKLLKVYLETFRPIAQDNIDDAGTKEKASMDNAPLFLTWFGNMEQRIGYRVTAFFKETIGIPISTTSIRSLVETESDQAFKKGLLDLETKESIHSLNGHSGRTSKDYYQKEIRARDVRNARIAFNTLTGHPSSSSTTSSNPTTPHNIPATPHNTFNDEDDDTDNDIGSRFSNIVTVPMEQWDNQAAAPVYNAADDWGLDHPEKDSENKHKIKWSEAEINYIGRFTNYYNQHYPGNRNVMAECLNHLRVTPTARRIFHPHHTVDSARMRSGFERWKAREAKQKKVQSMFI
jgi:hypothetical protein